MLTKKSQAKNDGDDCSLLLRHGEIVVVVADEESERLQDGNAAR
jgi:hypothetical protein